MQHTVILRNLQLADAPALATQANNKNVADNLRDVFPHPYSLKDAEGFITLITGDKNLNCITKAIEVDGAFAGIIGIVPKSDVHRLTAEIGYWLGESFWGKGIGTCALSLMVNYAFEQFNLVRLFATTYEPNKASARILQKVGFLQEGVLRQDAVKNGEILNTVMYSLLRQEWAAARQKT